MNGTVEQMIKDIEGVSAAEACAGDIEIVRNGGKDMDRLQPQRKYEYGGAKRNSYYDIRPHYSQKENDECRIIEGISKKIKDYTKMK